MWSGCARMSRTFKASSNCRSTGGPPFLRTSWKRRMSWISASRPRLLRAAKDSTSSPVPSWPQRRSRCARTSATSAGSMGRCLPPSSQSVGVNAGSTSSGDPGDTGFRQRCGKARCSQCPSGRPCTAMRLSWERAPSLRSSARSAFFLAAPCCPAVASGWCTACQTCLGVSRGPLAAASSRGRISSSHGSGQQMEACQEDVSRQLFMPVT
mmetsp:Transcript_102326/g.318749  ORF Transcript_102326/g.318749 Transcript_102326/m.318749 type:complete len:210 (-) Transcript_102326:1075-1704(-)